jgi:hypothetical protein
MRPARHVFADLDLDILQMEVDDRDPAIEVAPIAEIIRQDRDGAQADLGVQGEPIGDREHGAPVRSLEIDSGMQVIRCTVTGTRFEPIFAEADDLAVQEVLAKEVPA